MAAANMNINYDKVGKYYRSSIIFTHDNSSETSAPNIYLVKKEYYGKRNLPIKEAKQSANAIMEIKRVLPFDYMESCKTQKDVDAYTKVKCKIRGVADTEMVIRVLGAPGTLANKYESVELLMIGDFGKDLNLLKLLSNYQKADDNIRVVFQKTANAANINTQKANKSEGDGMVKV